MKLYSYLLTLIGRGKLINGGCGQVFVKNGDREVGKCKTTVMTGRCVPFLESAWLHSEK